MRERSAGLDGVSTDVAYLLLRTATAEVERLRRVRGAYRRTARRMRRALAMLGLAGALLGLPLAGVSRAVEPIFSATSTNPFGLANVGMYADPTFVDIDGDGFADAFVGSQNGNLIFFKFRRSAPFWIPTVTATSTNPFGLLNVGNSSAPGFADIDADGDFDAFVGTAAGNTTFFRNTGTAIAPAFAAPSANPFALAQVGLDAEPAFADIDGDGDFDAFVGQYDGQTIFFRNTGTAIAPAFASPSTNPFGLTDVGAHARPTLVDVDADGDLDAFVGNNVGDTVFFRNIGTAVAPAFASPVTNPFGLADVGYLSSPTFVDLFGDGAFDAVVGNLAGNLIFFSNTAVSPPPEPSFAATSTNPFGLSQVGGLAIPFFADIDGDGDLDAFVGQYNGDTVVFLNTGSAVAPAFATPSTNPWGLQTIGARSAPALADVDADGDLDALIGNNVGNMIFYRNTGSAIAPAFAAPIVNPYGLSDVGWVATPAFGDVDGDGDFDLLVGEIAGYSKYFLNVGTPIAPSWDLVTNGYDSGAYSRIAIGDIDGDGTLDLLIGVLTGDTVFYRNVGNPRVAVWVDQGTNPFGLANVGGNSAPAFASIRSNGHPDVFIGNNAGNLIYFRNDAPTPARVVSQTAARWADGAVFLEWRTSQEVDHLGMRVWRDVGAGREQVTPGLVAGTALTQGGVTLEADSTYGWWDRLAPDAGAAVYWLEAVDLDGRSTWHGPIVPEARTGEAPTTPTARLLEEVGRAQAASASTLTSGAEAAAASRRAAAASEDPGAVVSPSASAEAATADAERSLARQRRLAAGPAAKLTVRERGWYRVTYEELAAAGFDPGDGGLGLYLAGERQALRVGGTSGGGSGRSLGPGAWIEFYGEGRETPESDAQTYWLVAGGGGRRNVRRLSRPAGEGGAATYEAAVTWAPKTVFSAGLKNGDAENFYGPPVTAAGLAQTIFLSGVAADGPATVTVALRGLSFVAHRVEARLNGTLLGDLAFDRQESGARSFPIPPALLSDGENRLELRSLGTTPDVSLVERVEIRFPRAYAADGDEIAATTEAPVQTLSGFGTPDVRVFDVTRPERARELVGTVTPAGDGHAVSVRLSGGGERHLLALTDAQIKTVAAIESNVPSRLAAEPGGADLVIVTHGDYAAAAADLAAARRGDGLAVTVVDVADVFDEYGWGTPSPDALRAFLAHAWAEWQPRPRWVLLLGDATYDPKDHLGSGVRDDVPTRLVETRSMETASDDWLVDVDGDGRAEMAVGRLPVRSAEAAARLVAKLIGGGAGASGGTAATDGAGGAGPAASGGALLISDRGDGEIFAHAAAALGAELSGVMGVTEVRRGTGGAADDAIARAAVLDGLAANPALVAYLGHGGNGLWRGDLLTAESAAALRNAPAVVASMTCLSGSFQDPLRSSLAEALLSAEGGAVAVWASSGMTGGGSQADLLADWVRRLAGSGSGAAPSGTDPAAADGGPSGDAGTAPRTLGEAALEAKAASGDGDARTTYNLLGDPSMKLRR